MHTAKEIAEKTGLSFVNVRQRIRRLGIEPAERFKGVALYNDEQVERIRENKKTDDNIIRSDGFTDAEYIKLKGGKRES